VEVVYCGLCRSLHCCLRLPHLLNRYFRLLHWYPPHRFRCCRQRGFCRFLHVRSLVGWRGIAVSRCHRRLWRYRVLHQWHTDWRRHGCHSRLREDCCREVVCPNVYVGTSLLREGGCVGNVGGVQVASGGCAANTALNK